MSDKNIPSLPTTADPKTRKFLSFVRSKMIRMFGSGNDRVVTFEDLVDLGLIDKKSAEMQAVKR